MNECPVSLECRLVAEEWLDSPDCVVKDFGARLMALAHGEVPCASSEHALPRGLIPDGLRNYPWVVGEVRSKEATKLDEAPLRQFWVYDHEEAQELGMKVGIYWASPHWKYPKHAYQPFELLEILRGSCRVLADEEVPLKAGRGTFLHLPHQQVGLHCSAQPVMALWAERLLEEKEVPREIRALHAIQEDVVTFMIKRAAHSWLASQEELLRDFGRRLLPLIEPRRRGFMGPHAPANLLPAEFRSCPWLTCGAHEYCRDAKEAQELRGMRQSVLYKGLDSLFGLFYVPKDVHYPAHSHKPLEIYHILSGEADFFLADVPEHCFEKPSGAKGIRDLP